MSKIWFNIFLALVLLSICCECIKSTESKYHQLHRYYYDDNYYYSQPKKSLSGVGLITALIISLICGLICFCGVRYYCQRRREGSIGQGEFFDNFNIGQASINPNYNQYQHQQQPGINYAGVYQNQHRQIQQNNFNNPENIGNPNQINYPYL